MRGLLNISNCENASSSQKRLEFKVSAGVAQLVEQRIRNAKVVGSNPISGTIIPGQATLQAHIEVHLQDE